MDKFTEANREAAETPVEHQLARTNLVGSTEQLSAGELVEGRYKVLGVVASGGFGCVYKVRNVFTKQIFALKTLHAKSMSETAMLRFRKEAQTASKLDHPNLVRAYDFGLIGDVQPYLVMDFVEGPNLAGYLKLHTRIPLATALDIFIPICYAMSYAHDQGVIHRDIKPGNIILAPDPKDPDRFMAKVVDFGIAKFQFGDESEALTLTRTGEIFGTPLYMSPEQCAGSGTDERSDIYAFGCVMFEALTGAPPFRGNTALETMIQHATAVALSLKNASLGVDFPEAMERIMAKTLAKDSRDRFQNFADLGNQLLHLQSGDVDGLQLIAVPKGTTAGITKKLRGGSSWIYALSFVTIGAAITAAVYQNIVVAGYQRRIDQASTEFERNQEGLQTAGASPFPHLLTGFFRRDEGQSKFIFPEDSDDIGELYCWEPKSGACKHVPARGEQEIPLGSGLVLKAKSAMLRKSFNWGFFLPNDLRGAVIDNDNLAHGTSVLEDDDSAALIGICAQANLSVLDFSDLELSRRAFDSMGLIDSLRFLRIKGSRIATEQSFVHVTGADIAKLTNLPNLETLVLNDVYDLGPLFKRLKDCHLRGLYLISSHVKKSDLALLKNVHSLEHFGMVQMSDDFELGDALNTLTEVPNLKEVLFTAQAAATPATRRFSKLKHFVFVGLEVAPVSERRLREIVAKWAPAGANVDKILVRETKMLTEFPFQSGLNQNPFKPGPIKLSDVTLGQ